MSVMCAGVVPGAVKAASVIRCVSASGNRRDDDDLPKINNLAATSLSSLHAYPVPSASVLAAVVDNISWEANSLGMV